MNLPKPFVDQSETAPFGALPSFGGRAMPLAAVLVMIDVMFVWHAVKTGRCSPWCYIILALPGVGAAAYILVELFPEWLNSFNGQKAQIRRNNIARSLTR